MLKLEYPQAYLSSEVFTGVVKCHNDQLWHALKINPRNGQKRSYTRVTFEKAQAILLAIREQRDLTKDEANL